ncbi:MAG: polysaccharide deacetylase family protein, partial [Chthoniobacterales bacterium]
MYFRRAFSVCCFSLLALQTALAQSNPPADADPPSAPTASPSQQLTFSSVHVDGPYVAMTFDDGPSAALTPKLLDLLAAHHMKVTF